MSQPGCSPTVRKETFHTVSLVMPHVGPGLSVLDVGCGQGWVAEELVRRGVGDIALVDVVDVRRSPARPFTLYDGVHLPFPDARVDERDVMAALLAGRRYAGIARRRRRRSAPSPSRPPARSASSVSRRGANWPRAVSSPHATETIPSEHDRSTIRWLPGSRIASSRPPGNHCRRRTVCTRRSNVVQRAAHVSSNRRPTVVPAYNSRGVRCETVAKTDRNVAGDGDEDRTSDQTN